MSEDFKIFTHESQIHLSIGENYKYSPVAILAHVLKLESTKVLAQKSWILTDDYQAEFSFKGRVFVISTFMDSVDISPHDKNVPNELAKELYGHIKDYTNISFFQRLSTFGHCFFKPFNYRS